MTVIKIFSWIAAGLLLFACAQKPPEPRGPALMPLTMENVASCSALVEQAKARARRPEGKEAFTGYVAAVYVAPLRGQWLVKETLAAALAEEGRNQAADELLKALVYDPQLTAALTGETFTGAEWREIYLRAGLLDEASFNLLERSGERAE